MALWNNLVNYFAGGTVARETRETLALYDRVDQLQRRSAIDRRTAHKYVVNFLVEAYEEADVSIIRRFSDTARGWA